MHACVFPGAPKSIATLCGAYAHLELPRGGDTWQLCILIYSHSSPRMESLLIFKAAILRACNFAFFLCSVPIAMYIVFVAYTLSGGVLSPRKVFTVLVLLYYLRLTSVLFFVANTLGISEGSVAFKRIQVRVKHRMSVWHTKMLFNLWCKLYHSELWVEK